VPAALTLLAERTPGLRVEISELPPEEGLFELGARGFDLAIAEQYPGLTRPHRSALDRDLLGVDPIRLATARAIGPLADLAEHAWVMEPRGTAAREWAMQQCRAAGFEPDVRFELADLSGHAELIAAGHAVGLLPDLLWAGGAPPVHLSALPGDPAREIFTAARRSSRSLPGIRSVRDALADAFVARRV